MSLQNLFRIGKPRVTETTDNFKCGRGTGGMGTGVYAYADLKAAKEDYSFKEREQPIYELPDICQNPIEPIFFDDTIKLNKAGRKMVCGEIDDAVMELRFIDAINGVFINKYNCNTMFSEDCANKLKVKVESAMKKEDNCFNKHKKDEPHGSKHCVQPMNHLLKDLGFDCVLPSANAGGNSNEFGSIILKETIDKHLGRKTVGYEDIDDFGVKILNKLEK